MAKYNPNRTDNLKYNYIGINEYGDEVGEVFNDKIFGFCYWFNLKYSSKKEAFRYSMGVLKNISLIKRLKHD